MGGAEWWWELGLGGVWAGDTPLQSGVLFFEAGFGGNRFF